MPKRLSPGDLAPAFTLSSSDGRTISLKELRGSTVVLYFYPKDDTPGCTREACDVRDNLSAFQKKGVVVVGVSADDEASHRKFSKKFGLSFPLLSDPDRIAIRAYGVWKKKMMFGRAFMGIERTTFVIGPNGRIQEVYRKVNVDGHVREILASL